MTLHNQYRRVLRSAAYAAILATCVVLPGSSGVSATDIVERPAWKNSIEAQGSFNYARRGDFRDIYGNGVSFALRYERALNDKIGWGIRVSRVQLSNDRLNIWGDLKYREFAVIPMVTYSLARSGGFRFFAGGGFGLSFRKVTLESFILDQFGQPSSSYEASQSEANMGGLLMLGSDISLFGEVFFAARVSFDHHFFGDTNSGDFGDTGGFNLGGGIGFTF